MKESELGAFDEDEDIANQEFYDWEDRVYPHGNSPLSDYDRALFITAWVLGFRYKEGG